MSLCHGERVDITIKTAQQNRIYAVMNPSLLQLISKRQIARLGQLAFLCDTLKDTKKLVVF